jgi:hypothetical protein
VADWARKKKSTDGRRLKDMAVNVIRELCCAPEVIRTPKKTVYAWLEGPVDEFEKRCDDTLARIAGVDTNPRTRPRIAGGETGAGQKF